METKNMIKQYILKEIMTSKSEDSLNDEQSLIQSGIIDSLTIMKIMNFLEETFNFKISDDELIPENFETLTAMYGMVQRKLAIK
jgi:methoxymalonate biosynthesis acyl carrier protein